MSIKWIAIPAAVAVTLALVLAAPAQRRRQSSHAPEQPASGPRLSTPGAANGVPMPAPGASSQRAPVSIEEVDRTLASIEQRVKARGVLSSSDLAEADLAITGLKPLIGDEAAQQRLTELNGHLGALAQQMAALRTKPLATNFAPPPSTHAAPEHR